MAAPLSSPRVRTLAAALKQARESCGVSQRDLASRLELTHPILSYWESGKRVPTPDQVAAFLSALGIDGFERQRILELAFKATDANWLTTGFPGMSPAVAGVLDCEATATRISGWSTVIPGLLQIPRYTAAILEAGGSLPREDIQPMVAARMERQKILDDPNRVEFDAYLHLGALQEPFGGVEAFADQLRHVLEMAERPNVTIRAVQGGVGWHPGFSGPFIVYDFADTPSIVSIEHYYSNTFLYEEGDVLAFQDAVRMVRGVAMSPTATAELIAGEIAKLEKK